MIGKVYNKPYKYEYIICDLYIDYNNIHNKCLRFNVITLETYYTVIIIDLIISYRIHRFYFKLLEIIYKY